MNKTLMLTLAAAVLAVLLPGCKSHEGAYTPVNATQFDVENKEKAVLMDPGAQRSVTYPGIQEGSTPDGRLDLAVNVRTRENRRIEVQINCEFKDAQGFALDTVPWQTLILTENAQETVRFTALNTAAKLYTIRIRQAR